VWIKKKNTSFYGGDLKKDDVVLVEVPENWILESKKEKISH